MGCIPSKTNSTLCFINLHPDPEQVETAKPLLNAETQDDGNPHSVENYVVSSR